MRDEYDVVYRLAGLNDANQLADLRWRLKTDDAKEFDQKDRDSFRAGFIGSASGPEDHRQLFHWVADLHGRLIGVMSVRKVVKVPSPKQMNGHWGYLTNCYTLPDFRNRGIGAGLLDTLKAWAKEQNFELLAVWPSDRSYPFYERSCPVLGPTSHNAVSG
jgi:GNAT superfamily N-acetyltransferase